MIFTQKLKLESFSKKIKELAIFCVELVKITDLNKIEQLLIKKLPFPVKSMEISSEELKK